MPEVREFCKLHDEGLSESSVPFNKSAEPTLVQIRCDHVFEGISIRDGLACVVSDYYKKFCQHLV